MAKRRFSRLSYALKSLQSPLGGTDNNPVTGSILANYKDFRDGKTVVNYTRAPESLPGNLVEIAVNPFFKVLDATTPARVKISKRVLDQAGLSSVRTAANILTTVPEGAVELKNYVPAKAIVFIPGVQSNTKKPSQITGVTYNPKEGNSYTIPFGQATGEIYEGEVRGLILTAVAGIGGAIKSTVTFTSEKVG